MGKRTSSCSEPEEQLCWICHGTAADGGHEGLVQPCKCPSMRSHPACLARWCLQSAGRSEERTCRFCQQQLPDWRDAHAHMPKAKPVMTVVHGGETYQVSVEPGPEGQAEFMRQIRSIFGLAEEDSVQLTFGCKVPGSTASELTLEGWEAFDAAVHCASISSGLRQKRADSDAGSGSASGSGSGSGGSPTRGVTDTIKRLFSRGS